jgi:hypothetical protein
VAVDVRGVSAGDGVEQPSPNMPAFRLVPVLPIISFHSFPHPYSLNWSLSLALIFRCRSAAIMRPANFCTTSSPFSSIKMYAFVGAQPQNKSYRSATHH